MEALSGEDFETAFKRMVNMFTSLNEIDAGAFTETDSPANGHKQIVTSNADEAENPEA